MTRAQGLSYIAPEVSDSASLGSNPSPPANVSLVNQGVPEKQSPNVANGTRAAKPQKEPQHVRQRFVFGRWLIAAAALVAWLLASYQFPETMHQVRLVLLLIATGGLGD